MRRNDVEAECLDQGSEAWRLTLGQVEDQPGERGGVDDRMGEGALEATTDKPCVESVMAVLDEHGALRETEECAPRVSELWGADQHRAIDVVAPASVWIDRRAAVDQRVEKRKRAVELESLGPDLQHQKRSIARRLHVQGHELSVLEARMRTQLRRIDGDLLPPHRLDSAARFEENWPLGHLANASALRANAISSAVTARSSSAAPA